MQQADIFSAIERLADLRANGILSEEEFANWFGPLLPLQDAQSALQRVAHRLSSKSGRSAMRYAETRTLTPGFTRQGSIEGVG